MKVYLVSYNWNYGGTSTYIETLRKYLDTSDIKNADIVFTWKLGTDYGKPSLKHIHAPLKFIPICKDVYQFWNHTNISPMCSVNSENQKREMLENDYPFEKENIFVLPNSIDDKYYIKNHNIEKKKKSIVYLGNMRQDNKDVFISLAKAMEFLPDYKLTVIGNVYPHMIAAIEQIKMTNINFIGEKLFTEKIELIQQHEIGVGIGRCMMEMILLGLPVLAFRNGYNGWVTDNNVKKLQYDNYTTRSWKDDNNIVDKIIKDIKEPKFMTEEMAIKTFGMSQNVNVYKDTFRKVIEKWHIL